jgi:hypothetical protein
MKAMLSNGMHLALVEGSGAASGTPWLAVGRLHGATCYVKVQAHETDKTVTIAVHTHSHSRTQSLADAQEEGIR